MRSSEIDLRKRYEKKFMKKITTTTKNKFRLVILDLSEEIIA